MATRETLPVPPGPDEWAGYASAGTGHFLTVCVGALTHFLVRVLHRPTDGSDTVCMVNARILGSVGRFLITSGIVVLLFVAYQLWGTGLQEAQAQDSLSSEFDELLGALDSSPATTASTAVDAPASTTDGSTTTAEAGPTTTTTPASTTSEPTSNTIAYYDEALALALYREAGEAIARLTIPAIDVRKVVVAGVKVEDLRDGPGHYPSTVLPGQSGNTGIAGHRTTYGAPFNRIDELVPGDKVTIRTVQGLHEYRVLSAEEAFGELAADPAIDFAIPEGEEDLGHIIVRPADTWVLRDFGDNRVTLTACHPKYSAARRIIVAAELVTDPVDSVAPPGELPPDEDELVDEDVGAAPVDEDPTADKDTADAGERTAASPGSARTAIASDLSLDEGLDGDETALVPAILWGLAAIATYTAFKQLARRWRFWPAIALGVVPVTLLMAASFEHIDRYLPAG